MSYAAALPRYSPRLMPIWAPPSWQQVAAGLPILPPLFLFTSMALLPVYTLSVVLLDAAPAVPTAAWGAIVAAAIGVVAWLLNRTITAFDNSVKDTREMMLASNKENKEAILALSRTLETIGKEQTASSKLQEYLEKRIGTLEHKKEVLEKSFQEMDKLIAVKLHDKNKS